MYIALFFLSYHGKCYPAEISWNISAFSRYSLLQGSVLNGLRAQGTPYKIMRNVKKRKKVFVEQCMMQDEECPWKMRIISSLLTLFLYINSYIMYMTRSSSFVFRYFTIHSTHQKYVQTLSDLEPMAFVELLQKKYDHNRAQNIDNKNELNIWGNEET